MAHGLADLRGRLSRHGCRATRLPSPHVRGRPGARFVLTATPFPEVVCGVHVVSGVEWEDASVGSPKKILKKSCNFEAKSCDVFPKIQLLATSPPYFFYFFSKSLENETIPAYDKKS